MILLGLDISSATIGWATLHVSDEAVLLGDYGHISPPKSSDGSLLFRLDSAYSSLEELYKKVNPDKVVIEAYANKFSKGRSSAHTIIVLSVFNEALSLCCYKTLGIEPIKYTASSIRSSLSSLFEKKIVSKDDAFESICNFFDEFEVTKNNRGATKKQCYDEADAIAVCMTYLIKEGTLCRNQF